MSFFCGLYKGFVSSKTGLFEMEVAEDKGVLVARVVGEELEIAEEEEVDADAEDAVEGGEIEDAD